MILISDILVLNTWMMINGGGGAAADDHDHGDDAADVEDNVVISGRGAVDIFDRLAVLVLCWGKPVYGYPRLYSYCRE